MTGFMRSTALFAVLALTVSACAPGPRPDRAPAPWAALTSPTAALKVAFDEVCVAAVMEGGGLEQLALRHYLVPVSPHSTRSPTATAAWRLASYSNVFVMALPDGACSVSVEGGDPDALNVVAIEMLKARAAFAPSVPQPSTDGNAERIAWCTPEAQRPYVVTLLRRTSGRRVAFLANAFRAQGARPPFCA